MCWLAKEWNDYWDRFEFAYMLMKDYIEFADYMLRDKD